MRRRSLWSSCVDASMRTTHFLIPGDQLKASATNFKIKKVPLTTIIRWFGIRNPLPPTNDNQSAQKVSLHTHCVFPRLPLLQLPCSLLATNSTYQYQLATMISQRVIVLSALVALFALLSTADAQLRANNKRVLLEQEVRRYRTDVSVYLFGVRVVLRRIMCWLAQYVMSARSSRD